MSLEASLNRINRIINNDLAPNEPTATLMIPEKYAEAVEAILKSGLQVPASPNEDGIYELDYAILDRYQEWIEQQKNPHSTENECHFDIENNPYRFLVHIAIHICELSDLAKRIEAIYDSDAERFYLIFINNSEKNHYAFSEGNMLSDVRRKKVYSVLIIAVEDESVFSKVKKAFFEFDSKFEKYLKQPCEETLRAFEKDERYNGNDIKFYSHCFLCYYLGRYSGIEENKTIKGIKSSVGSAIAFREHYWEKKNEGLNDYKKQFDKLLIEEETWKAIRNLRGFNSVNEILRVLGLDISKNRSPLHVDIYDNKSEQHIHNLMKNGKNEDVFSTASILLAFTTIANWFGITPQQLIGERPISKEEQMLLLKAFSFPWDNLKSVGNDNFHNSWDNKKYDFDDKKIAFGLSSYVTAFILFQLIKRLSEAKEFYVKHSNETLFSTIEQYKSKAKENARELSIKQSEADDAKTQAKQIQAQLDCVLNDKARDNNAGAPFLSEIRQLKIENEKLMQQLAESKRQEKELFLLRELAFDIKSEYIPTDEEKFENLIFKKKIVVIGGHINWRKNLSKKYPSIQLYDGHIETADLKPIENADFVFLNVSNMSHGMYYKVMNVLRGSDIPFDYLGRTTNQELYEKEMADILVKRLAKT